jgi:hypothetical protein
MGEPDESLFTFVGAENHHTIASLDLVHVRIESAIQFEMIRDGSGGLRLYELWPWRVVAAK